MKKASIIAIACSLISGTAIAQHEVTCDFTSITSNITTNTTLSSSILYRLEGCIHVVNGVTLTIPQGTVIMGEKASTATLIIDKGAQLVSQGTSSNPVVFTSDQQPSYRTYGDWGGIAVLGYAPNNNSNSITLSADRVCSVTGGGTNANDNSGTYKFMRIEYPVHGLSMVSVGDGTTFHDVQVFDASENSLELYGGKVNFKRFVSVDAKRADILATHGNLSKAQYILGIRLDPNAHVSTDEKSNGILFANYTNAVGSANTYNSHPIFSNVTLVGPAYCGATGLSSDFKNAVLYEHSTEGGVYNSIIAGWPNGLSMEGATTLDNADLNYTLNFAENSLYGIPSPYYTNTGTWPANCAVDMDDWILGTSPVSCRQRNNEIPSGSIGFSTTICDDYCSTTPSFILGENELGSPHYNLATDLNNAFFDAFDFRGAFDASTDWTTGWTSFCAQATNYCPDAPRKGSPTGVSKVSANEASHLNLYPNPVSGIIYAEFTTGQSGKIFITIVNGLGQVVKTVSANAIKGNQKIAIPTDGLSSGLYQFNIELNKGTMLHAKVVVK